MRSRGPSKQRLWLGAGRYLCCGGRRYTDADAHCHANCQSHRDSIANSYAATDANTQSGAIGKAAPNASAEAIKFAEPRLFL